MALQLVNEEGPVREHRAKTPEGIEMQTPIISSLEPLPRDVAPAPAPVGSMRSIEVEHVYVRRGRRIHVADYAVGYSPYVFDANPYPRFTVPNPATRPDIAGHSHPFDTASPGDALSWETDGAPFSCIYVGAFIVVEVLDGQRGILVEDPSAHYLTIARV